MVPNTAPSWDLFPLSRQPFSDAQFANPSSEYRGTPLWSWNGKLEEGQLLRQIDMLEEMGFGGFHMHVRVGLDTEYLGEEFLHLMRVCVERAKKKNMKAWLYDEDRWPSGFASGKVTEKNENFRSRHLLFTPWKYGDPNYPSLKGYVFSSNKKHLNFSNIATFACRQERSNSAESRRSELGTLVARYSIELDEEGYLVGSKRLQDGQEGNNVWYAYEETNAPSEWFNDGYYLDTLNKAAVGAFIQSTHETFKSALGDEFGKTIPAIFSDEPQFAMKKRLQLSTGQADAFLPWTHDLLDSFRNKYGTDLLEALPEIMWDTRIPSKARLQFHDHSRSSKFHKYRSLLSHQMM